MLQETVFEDAFTLLSKGNIDPRMVIHLFSDLAASSRVNESPYVLLFDGVYGLLERTGRIEDMGKLIFTCYCMQVMLIEK